MSHGKREGCCFSVGLIARAVDDGLVFSTGGFRSITGPTVSTWFWDGAFGALTVPFLTGREVAELSIPTRGTEPFLSRTPRFKLTLSFQPT